MSLVNWAVAPLTERLPRLSLVELSPGALAIALELIDVMTLTDALENCTVNSAPSVLTSPTSAAGEPVNAPDSVAEEPLKLALEKSTEAPPASSVLLATVTVPETLSLNASALSDPVEPSSYQVAPLNMNSRFYLPVADRLTMSPCAAITSLPSMRTGFVVDPSDSCVSVLPM